jgi:hypothetical protein
MEIHRELGNGHDEVIYKDPLVVELHEASANRELNSCKFVKFVSRRVTLVTF